MNEALVRYAKFSHGRFLASWPPATDLPPLRRAVGWAWWGVKTLGHLVVRLTCLVSDLVVHDWHHFFPLDPNWPNAIWERARRVEDDPVRGPLFNDTWGRLSAVEETFSAMSRAGPVVSETVEPGLDVAGLLAM